MKEQIKLLLDLQSHDAELLDITKKLELLPAQLEEMGRDVAQLEQVVSQATEELEQETKWKDEKEEENRFIDSQVQTLRQKINASSRGHREVIALQKQLDANRKQSAELEGEILHAMEAIEARRTSITEQTGSLSALKSQLASEEKTIRGEMETLQTKLSELQRYREERLVDLDSSVRRRYDRIATRKHPSVVEVIDGRCTGCNMSLMPQLYNILHYANSLETCPTCHRLIFIKAAVFGEEPPAEE